MQTYKAIIVDDEMVNISNLEDIVSKYCIGVKIVGHAQTIAEVIAVAKATQPDIIFLDIKLKGKEVFEAFDKLDITKSQLIFVVASNDKYPLKAIKYNAVDYIVKPVILEDVVLATNKAIKEVERQRYIDSCRNQKNNALPKTAENNDYIAIASLDKVELLKTNSIMYAVSDSKYTTFHSTKGKEYVSNKNLVFYESVLNKSSFFRIHRTYIINIEFISRLIKKDGYYCELVNGIFLPISKRKQEDFNRFLKI